MDDDRVVFYVNGIEVLALDRDAASIGEETPGVFRVAGSEDPFFFHPSQRESFVIDLAGEATTTAQRVKMASSQASPRPGSVTGTSVAPKSRVAAGLLAIFLGGLGVHKFYLGEVGLGVVYLVFVWTFIPALIGFIEGIIYLTMSDEAFAARYG